MSGRGKDANNISALTFPNCLKALLFAVAVCGCVLLYLHVAEIQSGVNDDMRTSDQSAYMDFARKAYETGLQYTGNRNRTPFFPWITALFYAPQMTDEDFFETGKRVNVWLSVLLLAVLGIIFFNRFSRLYASYAILSIAFLVFVLKSPFFQAELLYFGLFAFDFILSISNLSAPTWRKSLAVGLLFGLAHFAKAAVLPALVIYLGSLVMQGVFRLLRRTLRREHILLTGKHAALVAIAFLAFLFPYLQESRAKYGSHFYNVNTTFYFWYDSWAEARAGTMAAGDRFGYPDFPPEEIPGLEKYLREHTPGEILGRIRRGAESMVGHSCSIESSTSRFGFCPHFGASLLLIVFNLPLLLRHYSWRELLDVGHIVFFAGAIFFIYALGAAWYVPISGADPRMFLVLAVPLMWTLGLIVHSTPFQALRLRVEDKSFRVFDLVFGLFVLILVDDIILVLTERAATMYGGN